MKKDGNIIEKIVSLSKRRGFVFQSSEIYGGLNGCWDYGPLGVEMLNNIKREWWNSMTFRNDIEGIDASILMHPKVWEASGHVDNFTDPMIDCKQCKSRFRVDLLSGMLNEKRKKKVVRAFKEECSNEDVKNKLEEMLSNNSEVEVFDIMMEDNNLSQLIIPLLNCPNCGTQSSFTSARQFNLMFKTFIGPVEDSGSTVFLRPETAQGIFVNFLNVQNSTRQKLPFGIAQIGKAFRNEINTKNFLFRTREFEQMEMQYFVKPSDDKLWYDNWKEQRINWYRNLGISGEKLKFHDHPQDKLAHYAKEATDIEFNFPFGWGEIEGVHNRTDFDLKRHEEFSGKSMKYFDEESKEKYTPYIIETSAGASRSFMAFLTNAYHEEEVNGETRTVLKIHKKLAPIKASILPLVNKDGMPELAKKIEDDIRSDFKIFYDDKGAVGRRYRRQDEIGTPFAITIDTQSLDDNTVTIRERDSMGQIRIPSDSVKKYLIEKLSD